MYCKFEICHAGGNQAGQRVIEAQPVVLSSSVLCALKRMTCCASATAAAPRASPRPARYGDPEAGWVAQMSEATRQGTVGTLSMLVARHAEPARSDVERALRAVPAIRIP